MAVQRLCWIRLSPARMRACIGLLPVTAFSIVLLAMIAAFLGMRLYSVLGKRTGHEQEPVLPRREERTAPTPLRLDDADVAPAPRAAAADASNQIGRASCRERECQYV